MPLAIPGRRGHLLETLDSAVANWRAILLAHCVVVNASDWLAAAATDSQIVRHDLRGRFKTFPPSPLPDGRWADSGVAKPISASADRRPTCLQRVLKHAFRAEFASVDWIRPRLLDPLSPGH